jgi:hypothetical protein
MKHAPNSALPVPAGRVVESCIYELRGIRVMLDRDLARLYGVETRALNQAVRRNIGRFPPDFMLSLTREEILRMSQIVISSDAQQRNALKFSKSVMAFTEQGVAMLSSVLHSPRAVLVNVEIMRAFVRLRRILAGNADLARRLDDLEKRYDIQFKVVFDAIRKLMQKPKPGTELPKRKIGFHVSEPMAKYSSGGKRKKQ